MYKKKFKDQLNNCILCNKEYIRKPVGRVGQACEDCYPVYRKAYNLYYIARRRAKSQNRECDITILWVAQQLIKPCPKTGIIFDLYNQGAHYGTRSPYTPSIDKINPLKGYTKENSQVVCWWYNVSKQQFTDEQVIDLCRKVVETADQI